MLIQVKKGESFYGRRGSERMKREDEGRYRLRAGIAQVALRSKLSGKPEVDSAGRPLQYSNEMASRHSLNQLQAWSKGRSTKTIIGTPGSSRRTPWPWEKK